MSGGARHQYVMLDGLRGIAAGCVVLFHFGLLDRLSAAPSHAYLAVDLFFLISGFVVAHAYEGRLDGGLSLGGFAKLRLLRLYPLHALGMLLGALVVGAAALRQGGGLLPIPAGLLLGLCFLPRFGAGGDDLFPLNGPAWSLMFELLANLLYAALRPRLSNRVLAAIVGVCGLILLVVGATGHPLNGGARGDGWWLGLPRVGFGFFLGVAMLRAHRAGRLRAPVIHPLLLIAGVLAVLLAPVPFAWSGPFDALMILCVLPGLVACAIAAEPRGRLRAGLSEIGRPSYALYALHGPLRAGGMLLAPILVGRWLTQVEAQVALAVILALIVLCAWAASRWYDPWARAGLTRLLTAGGQARPERATASAAG